MNVFIAGGSGAIGTPLVRALVEAGHHVTALTRSRNKEEDLRALGASPAVADALDRDALMAVVEAARPTHVIHQLTALPTGGPRRARDLGATNRLRIDGTRHLLDAAVHAGARRFVVGSFAMLSPREPARGPSDDAAAAITSMEQQVLERGGIDAVVLRYGMLYGLETPSTAAMARLVRKRQLPVVRGDQGQLLWIHVDDAVRATVRALDAAPAGAIYEIVDDCPISFSDFVQAMAEYTGSPPPHRLPAWVLRLVAPYMARMISGRMAVSNRKAETDLGWRPRYPTVRDGLAQMFRDTL